MKLDLAHTVFGTEQKQDTIKRFTFLMCEKSYVCKCLGSIVRERYLFIKEYKMYSSYVQTRLNISQCDI